MLKKLFIIIFLLFISIHFSNEKLYAQEEETISDSLVSIHLKDGSILKGEIIREDEENITIMTLGKLEIKIPKNSIISIDAIRGELKGDTFYQSDPNYTRLMFSPTGRPLRRGRGYFCNYYVFFTGLAYGFTNNISIMTGISILPGLSVDKQMRYIAPRFGMQISDNLSFSTGILYTSFAGEYTAGIAFATSTIGSYDKSITLGSGLGYTKSEDEEFEFAKHPIIMLGGNARLTNSIAFVSENWFVTGGSFEISKQPFGMAIRFFGDRFATDVGVIIIGEVGGFPIPWLSFTYNFGGQY